MPERLWHETMLRFGARAERGPAEKTHVAASRGYSGNLAVKPCCTSYCTEWQSAMVSDWFRSRSCFASRCGCWALARWRFESSRGSRREATGSSVSGGLGARSWAAVTVDSCRTRKWRFSHQSDAFWHFHRLCPLLNPSFYHSWWTKSSLASSNVIYDLFQSSTTVNALSSAPKSPAQTCFSTHFSSVFVSASLTIWFTSFYWSFSKSERSGFLRRGSSCSFSSFQDPVLLLVFRRLQSLDASRNKDASPWSPHISETWSCTCWTRRTRCQSFRLTSWHGFTEYCSRWSVS